MFNGLWYLVLEDITWIYFNCGQRKWGRNDAGYILDDPSMMNHCHGRETVGSALVVESVRHILWLLCHFKEMDSLSISLKSHISQNSKRKRLSQCRFIFSQLLPYDHTPQLETQVCQPSLRPPPLHWPWVWYGYIKLPGLITHIVYRCLCQCRAGRNPSSHTLPLSAWSGQGCCPPSG